jgi:hypothetical protein
MQTLLRVNKKVAATTLAEITCLPF